MLDANIFLLNGKFNYMKKFLSIITLALLLGISSLYGQEKDSLKFSFSGFTRFDYWNDTRVTDDAIEGIFSLVPSAKLPDSYGNDLNAHPSANALAVSSRIRLNISGQRVLGANASSLLEADFTGSSGSSRVRLRHAAITLAWPTTSLLIGSYWHPMVVPETFPSVLGLSTGAPLQAFNRSPQVTFTYKSASHFSIAATASWESDYTSNGPDGYSSKYLRNTSIPDFTLHLKFSSSKVVMGALGDIFILQPRVYTVSPLDADIIKQTSATVTSFSYQGYFKYSTSKFFITAKAMVGQNLAHYLMLGGYGTTSINGETGAEEYTPFTHFFTFLNIGYGKSVKPSIFIGYAKNLGTDKTIVGTDKNIYGRSLNIASLYRIAPNISWTIKNFMLAAEVEYTNAEYGTFEFPSKGKLVNRYHVSNTRVLLVAQYNF